MAFLKQSTSATIVMGPFVDSTDGFTPETALTINQANVRVSKNGGSFAAKNNATAASHIENGYYSVPIDTTDTGTLGRFTIATSGVTGALPVWMEYNVVLANVYDSLITSGDYLDVSTVQWLGTAPNALISGRVDANTSNAVTVSAQTNHPAVSVSAYTNFPQVTVSANLDKTNYTVSSGSITAVAGNVTGSVGSVTGAVGSVTGNVGGNVVGSVASVTNSVSVSAQTNHPDVSVSAYTNFPQVYVSAGQVTNVTGNVSGSVNSVIGSVGSVTGNVGGNVVGSVGSVTNPVTVGTNNDKTNYTVSGYTNFPSVNVSSVTNGALVSADFGTDYYNKIQSLDTIVTVGKVGVSAIDGGLYVGTSAYTNFPQVYVSAGQVTNVTGNISGSVNSVSTPVTAVSVTNPVTVGTNNDKTGYSITANTDKSGYSLSGPVSVSAYQNFPQVYVSAGTVTASSVTDKTGYSLAGSVTVSAYANFPQVAVSANLDKTGYSITANSDKTGYSITANTDKTGYSLANSVTVSAYTNFPQVYVSAGQVTNVTGNVSGSVNSVVGGVTVTTNNDKTGYSVTAQTNHPTVAVSAYSNFPQVTVSANLDKTNYTVSSGTITTVTGNVNGSVASVTNSVTVGTNNDKTGYSITANTDKTGYSLAGSVGVSAYTNFPQVYVSAGTVTASSVTDKTGYTVTAGTIGNVTNPVVVSAYTNFPQVTVSANLDKTNYTVSSGSITTVTGNVGGNVVGSVGSVTGNVGGSVASVTNPVSVSAQTNHPQVSVSAYTNFPQVYVSAGQVTNVTGNVSGSVNSVVGNVGGNVVGSVGSVTGNVGGNVVGSVASVTNSVSVSAQTNHPAVSVSAYTNFPQVTVSANLDKTNYTVSSGSITAVAGNVTGSVASVTNPVTVGTNNDKTGYSLANSVTVSAYSNFPSVNVSSVSDGTIVSADFGADYWNKISSLETTEVTVTAYQNFPQVYVSGGIITSIAGSVQVSGIDGGLFVGTSAYSNFPQVFVSGGNITNIINPVTVSAYQNFPQVTVSANLDKTNYTVSSGSITAVNGNITGSVASVTNPVTANSIPQVQVSGINGGLYVGTSAYTNFPQVYVSAGIVNSVTNSVIVSAYQNFPSVNVSSVTDGTIVSADFGVDYWNRVQLGLATSTSVAGVQTTVNQISADTGAILTDTNEIQSKLPAGQIAGQEDIAAIIQNTRFVAAVPTEVIVPSSGSLIYEIKVYFYNMSGTMENPDGEIAIEANSVRQLSALTEFYNDISGAVHASISPTFSGNYYAMTSASVGVWQTYYKFATSAFILPDQIVFDFALKENTKELHYGRTTTLYSQTPGSMELASTDINKEVIARAIREFDASTISIGTNSVEKTIENAIREPKTVSAYTNFPQVTVLANLDKMNYTVSSGTINNLTNSVVVSAYSNFPQVTVSANLDKMNYTVSSGTINNLTNSVVVSAYQNFPSVNVSSVTNGTITCADFDNDYWTKLNERIGTPVSLDGGTATIAGMLTKMADDNGGASFDATTDSLRSINTSVAAGLPTYVYAWSGTIVSGTNVTGSFSSTYLDNGIYWQTTPNGTNQLDQLLYFRIGTKSPATVLINGRYQAAANRFVNIFTWNYITSAWDQISDSVTRMNNASVDANYEYILNTNQVDGTSAGNAIIRFLSDNSNASYNLYLDLVTIKAVAAGSTPDEIAEAVYLKMKYTVYDGAVWIDTVNGVSGTDVGVHGLPTNPVNNLADAITIANTIGIRKFHILPGSNITLTQAFNNWLIVGEEYTVNGNGQDCSFTRFEGATISGTFLGATGDIDIWYGEIGNATLPPCDAHGAGLLGMFTMSTAGDYYFDQCFSQIAGNNTPSATFNSGVNANFRHYSGGILVSNYTSANNMSLEGFGQIKFDTNCTGGSIAIRGTIRLGSSVPSGVTLVDSSRYENTQVVGGVTNGVTVSAVVNGTITSADFGTDYWNKVDELQPRTVAVSAYQNFPQVTVSANLDKTNYTVSSGTLTTVESIINPVTVSGFTSGISVSATVMVDYEAIKNASVSAINEKFIFSGTAVEAYSVNEFVMPTAVTVSAYQNFPQVTVSANLDKTNYTVSSGTINNITNSVSVSAYQNFPQVTVSANLDKTNYTVSSGIINTVTNSVTVSAYQNFPSVSVSGTVSVSGGSINSVINPVIVSAYQNFPQVQVSGINSGIQLSATAVLDYVKIKDANVSAINQTFTFSGSNVNAYSVNESVIPEAVTVSAYTNFPQVQVSGINTGVYGSVSAFMNMPQVTVSANLDKMNYTVSSGMIDTVNNPVTVSAYQNFPSVSVSGTVQVAGGTIDTVNNPVTVSAYQNFPEVTVVSAAYGTFHDYSFAPDYFDAVQQGMASASQVTNVQTTVDAISAVTTQFSFTSGSVNAYSTNEIAVSAFVTTPVTVSAYQNFPQVQVSGINTGIEISATVTVDYEQIKNANVSAINETFTFSGTAVEAYSVNQPEAVVQGAVTVSAYQNFPQVQVSGINSGITVSAELNYNAIKDANVSAIDEKFLFSGTAVEAYSVNQPEAVVQGAVTVSAFTPIAIDNIVSGVWNSSSATSTISGGTVVAIQNQFTFNSPGIVNSFVSGGIVSADPVTIINALLATSIDGKTFEELMEILLAMASGRITRVNNKFTYYKQDNTTALYTLESERSERTRL